jgi:hypothetical protein
MVSWQQPTYSAAAPTVSNCSGLILDREKRSSSFRGSSVPRARAFRPLSDRPFMSFLLGKTPANVRNMLGLLTWYVSRCIVSICIDT